MPLVKSAAGSNKDRSLADRTKKTHFSRKGKGLDGSASKGRYEGLRNLRRRSWLLCSQSKEAAKDATILQIQCLINNVCPTARASRMRVAYGSSRRMANFDR